MAEFLIGVVGYGASILCIVGVLHTLARFSAAPRHSKEEKGHLIAAGVFAVAAILLAIFTHWLIRISL